MESGCLSPDSSRMMVLIRVNLFRKDSQLFPAKSLGISCNSPVFGQLRSCLLTYHESFRETTKYGVDLLPHLRQMRIRMDDFQDSILCA